MNFMRLRKFTHHREFAENLRKRFRVARARRRFAIVFRKLQRVREQKRIQPGGRARRTVSRGDASETLLFLPQMQLGKKVLFVEGDACDALAKVGDRFRDGSHACFVPRRKKKWAEERTMNAVAKREPGLAHA